MKKFAFTLGEVLVTLAIVGIIAGLVIPGVIQNVHNRSHVLLLRKTLNSVGILVRDSSMKHNYKGENMEFKTEPEKVYTKLDIAYVKKYSGNSAGCFNSEYYTIAGTKKSNFSISNMTAVVFKNGLCLAQTFLNDANKDEAIVLDIDVNGKAGPNMIGVDYYKVYMYLVPGNIGSTEWKRSPGDFTGDLTAVPAQSSEYETVLEGMKKQCYNGDAGKCAEALIRADFNPDYMKNYKPSTTE